MNAPRRAASPVRAGSIGLGAVLAAGMALSMAPPTMIGVLSRFIIDDLDMTRTELGGLITGYALAMTVSSLPLGSFADRLGGRRMLVLLLACLSFGLLGMAASGGLWPLMLFAGVAAMPAAGANSATNLLIVENVPAGSRGWITGVKQAGVHLGIFAAGAALPVTALNIGWRWALALSALAPAGAIAFTLYVVPKGRGSPAAGRMGLFGSRLPEVVWWLAVYGVAMGVVHSAYIGFAPLYFQEKIGMSAAGAGAVIVVYGLVGAAGRIVWGRIAERAGDPALPLLWIGGMSVGSMLLTWAAADAGPLFAWAGAALLGIGSGSWTVVGMVSAMSAAPKQTGLSAAAVMLGFGAGLTAGPVVFGWAVDSLDGYGAPWWGLVFMSAVSMVIMLLWNARSKRPARGQPK